MIGNILNYFKYNKRDITRAVIENYFYGFFGWMIPVSVMIGDYRIAAMTALIFYGMLSIIVNRDKYITNLGKFFWFPFPAMLGAISALFIGDIIKNLI